MSLVSQKRCTLCQRQPREYLYKRSAFVVEARATELVLQLLSSEILMLILRVGIEHVEKRLFGEVRHLLLYWLRIPHSVALWKAEVW